jgi:hypothetical protein
MPTGSIVDYDDTIYVSPYPWEEQLFPYSDKCLSRTPDSLRHRLVGNTTRKWLDSQSGALFQCVFEETIDVPSSIPRWYESEG